LDAVSGIIVTTSQPGLSAIDQAHALRLRGKPEDALRLAASVLTAAPEQLDAAALVARLLLERQRGPIANQVALRLGDACIRRGDLPGAWLAAQLSHQAGGGAAQDALRRIAEAFGKGSPRVSNAAPTPPALPQASDIAPHFAKLSGDALLDAAEKAAARFLKTPDPLPASGPLPALPLFGALQAPALLKLLGRLELRELDAGGYLLKQDEEGREAFVLARGVLNVVREDASSGAPVLLAVLGPGAMLGEMALVSGAPRAASAVAVEPVQALCIARSALEDLARQDAAIGRELGMFCYSRMIANLMRHSAILSAVEASKRAELVARFNTEQFAPGDVLVHQGSEGDRLFLIASGGVQVRGKDADGDRVVLAELGPGNVVGEISLVLRRPANADVVAVHATVALSLSREQFHEAIREHPALLQQLYDVAIARHEETRSVVGRKAVDASDFVLV
jgi:cAMP-dependent protein kinase regulator